MIEPEARVASADPRPWHASPLLRIAAVLAVVLGTGLVLGTPHDIFVDPPMESYTSAAGERTRVRLEDGTRIILAPESEVRVLARFPVDEREVELRGAAYFDVAPDPRRPFLVRAGGTVTRVLGTRFVVRAYAEEPGVEIGVEHGRVAVRLDDRRRGDALEVADGQVARLDAGGAARIDRGAGIDQLLAWVGGRIVFDDQPLAGIAREIERWYDVDIRIADPALAGRALTLSFHQAPLEDVLGVITASLDAVYQIDGRSVTLRQARAAP